MRNRNKMRGFTLMELIITIGIISLLIAAGVPLFTTYAKHNASRIAAQDIKNILLEAQRLSLSPSLERKGADYYYVSIDNNQDLARLNGNLELGSGNLDSSGLVDEGSKRRMRTFKIEGDAWIKSIEPADAAAIDVVTYYYLIPTSEMLFNGKEPNPGIGYSLRCQTQRGGCFYTNIEFSKSYIQVRSTENKDSSSLESGDQLIVVDGNGGNIDVSERFRR